MHAAREAVTLLDNDGILPLDPTAEQRVLIVGEFARTPRFQGGGSSRVVPTRTVTALDSILGFRSDVAFEPGFTLDGADDPALADAAVAAAAHADVVVAFLGLGDGAESEGFDRTTLALPAAQLSLLARLKDAGTPVVVVLSNGSVVEVSSWRDGVAAIIEGWLLGQEGGRAVAEVLFGAVNPSGRLTETIPHRLEDTPSHLTFPGRDGQVLYGEDIFVGYRSYDTSGAAVAFPFGHGLSYTTFSYESLDVVPVTGGGWSARVVVRNTGDRAGGEVVQLYVAPEKSAVTRPAHELRNFAKVFLEPGESATVALEVADRDLAFWNTREQRWQVEPGDYRIEVGASSRDLRLTALLRSEGDGVVDVLRMDSTFAEWAAHPAAADVVARLRAGIPDDLASRVPELVAMVNSTPVVKLVTWGFGLTEELVREVVRRSGGVA